RWPQKSQLSRREILNTARPTKRISPETFFPGGSRINRIIERFATDFPDPDSPTMPRVSPRLSLKVIPSTALTVPSSVSKYVRRSLTSSRFPLLFISSTAPSPSRRGLGRGRDCINQFL